MQSKQFARESALTITQALKVMEPQAQLNAWTCVMPSGWAVSSPLDSVVGSEVFFGVRLRGAFFEEAIAHLHGLAVSVQ